ncbi:8974_t:CDS:2, partial [Ambispora leptoticha]
TRRKKRWRNEPDEDNHSSDNFDYEFDINEDDDQIISKGLWRQVKLG